MEKKKPPSRIAEGDVINNNTNERKKMLFLKSKKSYLSLTTVVKVFLVPSHPEGFFVETVLSQQSRHQNKLKRVFIFSCYIIIRTKTEKNNISNKKLEKSVNFFCRIENKILFMDAIRIKL